MTEHIAAAKIGQWTKEQAWEWYEKQPWIRGWCGYPSNCVNRIGYMFLFNKKTPVSNIRMPDKRDQAVKNFAPLINPNIFILIFPTDDGARMNTMSRISKIRQLQLQLAQRRRDIMTLVMKNHGNNVIWRMVIIFSEVAGLVDKNTEFLHVSSGLL